VRVDFTRLRVIENKTMRVESTRMHVIENNKTMRVESTRVQVESTRMRVVKKKQQHKKKLSTAGACRSKFYVYYGEFKVIFLMFLVELKLRISGLHVLRLMH
jgi:hypothetical protein